MNEPVKETEDETITLEPVASVEPVAVEKPTAESLREQNWSEDEITRGVEKGLVAKEGEEPAKKVAKKEVVAKTDEVVTEEKKEVVAKGSLPDMSMTPEQEKVFLEVFPPGTPNRAFYFRAKNERRSRQAAQAELKTEKEARAALEDRIKALESGEVIQTDEYGNEVDPDNVPLTPKRLREMQAEAAAAQADERNKTGANNEAVSTAQQEQEEYVREIHDDFDHAAKKAKDLIENLDALIPEKRMQQKVGRLIHTFREAAINADKFELDDDHGAFLVYELGQLHPSYNDGLDAESSGGEPKKKIEVLDPKANGGFTPEKMKRIAKNNLRRASSASVAGGGGKRNIAVEDVTLEDLNDMSQAKLADFREKHRAQYDLLLRG